MRILITSIVDIKRVTHNRIHVFAEYLSRKHDVTILCLNAWWLDESQNGQAGADYHRDPFFQRLFERTTILYLSNGRQPPLLQEFASLRNVNALLRQIDVASFDVHVNYGNLLAGYVVARKARRLGIPTVFDIADDLPARFRASPQVPRILGRPARLVAHLMQAANLRLAASVTFVTQALKDAYALPRDRALVIPNGVHADMVVLQSPEAVRKALGIEADFVLGFVGVLLPRVDLDLMFTSTKAISRKLPNTKLLVVGGGTRLKEAQDLARMDGISDSVIFTGFVPLSEVPQYISCMDVCLVPIADSLDCQRAFPIKLLEYMACEKPVVSTPLAGVRQAVGDRVLYAQDSGELASAAISLCENKSLRRRMGVEGRAFVQSNYDWERICHRFEATLGEAATEPAVGACSRVPPA